MDEECFRKDLYACYHMSSARGLKQSAKWAAELLYSLSAKPVLNTSVISDVSMENTFLDPSVQDADYCLAKSCFDLLEYERAAHYSRFSSSQEGKFIHFYSRYMSIEKKRLDLMAETNTSSQIATPFNAISMDISLNLYNELRSDLSDLYLSGEIDDDGFILYAYAIVLLRLDLVDEAVTALCKSIRQEPSNWAAWNQLALLIDDKDMIESLELPTHWFKRFFVGIVFLELQLNEEALNLYESLLTTFEKSNYILTQMAVAKDNLRNVEGSIEIFKMVRVSDPWRIDSMDVYSNLLYIKDMRADLSSLAHALNAIDPFRVETCCCIGNFYSLRSQHAKAVVFFSRALQLNPKHLSAWTLMGHEYMEMKNTGAAIQAYRAALKCNKRDYRAWYGLGQTYEILKMNAYCLYYYMKARSLRPNDVRIAVAMGEIYEKLASERQELQHDALSCYINAGKFYPFFSSTCHHFLPFFLLLCVFSPESLCLCQLYTVVSVQLFTLLWSICLSIVHRVHSLFHCHLCFFFSFMSPKQTGFPALTKLASLYDRMGEKEKAAAAYCDFIAESESLSSEEITQTVTNSTELALAYKFLSNFYFENCNYDEAYKAAEKCTSFPETREHGKQLCTEILKAKAGPT